jgi:hypothetical protein
MAIDQRPTDPLGEASVENVETTGDQVETLTNEQRGCGYLKENKTYLKADVSEDGTLPAFVELDEPVPWYEGHFRNWQPFPGVQFEVGITGDATGNATNPPGEVWNMLDRLAETGVFGSHAGEMRSATAHDLLDWVGGSYYETPADFIAECKTMGMSRAIGASTRQQPPVVNPGVTRCWFVHPTAIEIDRADDPDEWVDAVDRKETRPGIIGYSYVTRVVHTALTDGGGVEWPQWAKDYAAQGRLELVDIGEPEPDPAEAAAASLDEWISEADELVPLADVGFHRLRTIASEHDAVKTGSNPSEQTLRSALREAGVEQVPRDA